MNETHKKLSEEIAKEIGEIVKSAPLQDFITKTKDATVEDSGTFECIVSTADVDRQGESVVQDGWDLSLFKMNPVVLFGHDYYSLPIGICDSIEVVDGRLVAKGRFAPADANPFAQQVRKLYDLKIMRATSVGFIVKEAQGREITKAELIEFSFVPVPANPHALSMRDVQSLGIDLGMLAAKGMALKAEEDVVPEPTPEVPVETPPVEPEKPVEEEKPEEVPVETPTVEATPEGEIEAKGVVSDTLEGMSEAVWQAKWGNLDRVLPVVDAFISAYMHPSTKVEDFDTLWAECLGLLNGSTEAKALKTVLDERVASKRMKYIADKKAIKSVEAIGAAMTAMQSIIDDSIVKTSKEILEIAGGEVPEEKPEEEEKANVSVGSQDAGGDAGEEDRESDTPSQRSSTESMDVKAIEEWLAQRAILRAIATATTNALTSVNDRIRKERGF